MLRPLVKSTIEVTQTGKAATFGLELIRLDTDHWKSFVHERLRWPQDQPGGWHIHADVTEDYCRQLVAEARVMTPSGKPQWVQRSRENHYLDAEAMAAAAGYMLNVQHLRGQGVAPPAPVPQTARPVDAMSPAAHAVAAGSVIPIPRKMTMADRMAEAARRLNR